ncbi:MAG: Zn-ribbon containing protein [Candidatus Altiarchaeota archaeon]
MPHKCARCSAIYDEKAKELIVGCGCGSKVFLYLRADYAGSKEDTVRVLEDRRVDERDLKWLDDEFKDTLRGEGKTVSLDIENVLRIDEGKYELDLKRLMSGEPVVIKASEGVYYIDIKYGMKPKRK